MEMARLFFNQVAELCSEGFFTVPISQDALARLEARAEFAESRVEYVKRMRKLEIEQKDSIIASLRDEILRQEKVSARSIKGLNAMVRCLLKAESDSKLQEDQLRAQVENERKDWKVQAELELKELKAQVERDLKVQAENERRVWKWHAENVLRDERRDWKVQVEELQAEVDELRNSKVRAEHELKDIKLQVEDEREKLHSLKQLTTEHMERLEKLGLDDYYNHADSANDDTMGVAIEEVEEEQGAVNVEEVLEDFDEEAISNSDKNQVKVNEANEDEGFEGVNYDDELETEEFLDSDSDSDGSWTNVDGEDD